MNKNQAILILILMMIAAGLSAQVKIGTESGNVVYGIVIAEDSVSLTVRQPDNYKRYIPLTEMEYLEEIDSDIYTKDSTHYKGHIYFDDGIRVYLTVAYSETKIELAKQNIEKMIYDDGSRERALAEEEANEPSPADSGYFQLGVAIGTPGRYNIMFGYQFRPRLNLRVQCGIDGMNYGAQLDAGYNLGRTNHFEHNVSIAVGYSQECFFEDYPEEEIHVWRYTGIHYNLIFFGFHIDLGLSVGSGGYKSPQPIFQAGYVFRCF